MSSCLYVSEDKVEMQTWLCVMPVAKFLALTVLMEKDLSVSSMFRNTIEPRYIALHGAF